MKRWVKKSFLLNCSRFTVSNAICTSLERNGKCQANLAVRRNLKNNNALGKAPGVKLPLSSNIMLSF